MFILSGLSFHVTFAHFVFVIMQCGSGRSVAQIKAGFQARIGRRNAGT